MTSQERARGIWKQKQIQIPVIFRRGKGEPLRLRLPPSPENPREWIRGDKRRQPQWDPKFKCWEVYHAWLNWLVERILHRYGRVYLIQPFRVMEKCAPACWNATGFECECSCMGENHGSGDGSGFHVVSETFAFRWQTREYGCRLIVLRQSAAGSR